MEVVDISDLRANVANLFDEVVVNDEPLVVTRRGAEPMVVRERIAELNAGNGRLGKMIEDDDVRHNAA